MTQFRQFSRYGSIEVGDLADSGDEKDQAAMERIMNEHISEQGQEGQDADDEGGTTSPARTPRAPGGPARVVSTSRVGARRV